MTEINKRYIDIDGDTRVGYNYIKGQYYVTNKDTTTYRTKLQDILNVLSALEITSITDQDLLNLSVPYEDLYSISYTWQDNGAYIKTLQFNDFKDYALTIDCEKQKLYIMNSTTIYDLTTNESPDVVRIPHLCSFYKNTLGLYISIEDMTIFYNLLLSYYTPTCYNQIIKDEETEALKYNGIIILSNYNNTSEAVYHCIRNPQNKEIISTQTYHVINTDTNNNTITLAETPTEELLQVGDNIEVEGTEIILAETKYTADGTYKVTDISDNTITVAEPIPVTYEFPYIQCSVASAYSPIKEISRDTNTITVEAALPNILVGDTISIKGSSVTTEYEIITCDGSYTVSNIKTETIHGQAHDTVLTTITVEEDLPTNIVAETTGNITGYFLKEIFIGNIISIVKNGSPDITSIVVTLDRDIMIKGTSAHIGANVYLSFYNPTENTITIYQTASEGTDNTVNLKVDSDISAYTPNYPTLNILEIPEEIQINVTSVEDEYAGVFPTGEFTLDNFTQLESYVGLLVGLTCPTEENYIKLYSSVTPITHIGEYTNITMLGLYSDVYEESEEQ